MGMGPGNMVGLIAGGLVAFVGLGLSIGGLGGVHQDCNDATLFDENCADKFRASWWALNFSFFVLVGTAIFACTGALRFTRIANVFFLLMTAVEVMDEAEKALQLRDSKFWREINGSESAVDATVAGMTVLAAGQWLLIISLGMNSD